MSQPTVTQPPGSPPTADAPATPRAATTVLYLRDAPSGPEVLVVERSAHASFMARFVVFPGGQVDADDRDAGWSLYTTPIGEPRSPSFVGDETALALVVAALRESLEEAAVLPAGRPLADDELQSLRAALVRPAPLTFRRLVESRGLVLDGAALVPLSRWVTPTREARRYDTRFFVARAPEGQTGLHDAAETISSSWVRPSELLARYERGEVTLAPPTYATLASLAPCEDVDAALALARTSCLDPVCPELTFVPSDGGEPRPCIVLPGDPAHSIPERRAPGPLRYVLDGGRFRAESG